jgi:ribosomal protein L24E
MSKFCQKCGQKIPDGIGAMFAQSKPVEFEDGFYCENCAKIKVAEARG